MHNCTHDVNMLYIIDTKVRHNLYKCYTCFTNKLYILLYTIYTCVKNNLYMSYTWCFIKLYVT